MSTESSPAPLPGFSLERTIDRTFDGVLLRVRVGTGEPRFMSFDLAISGTTIAVLYGRHPQWEITDRARRYLGVPANLARALEGSRRGREARPDHFHRVWVSSEDLAQ